MRRKVYYIRNNLKYYNITLQKKDVIKYNAYDFKGYIILNYTNVKRLNNLLFYYKLKGHKINFNKMEVKDQYYLFINNEGLYENFIHDKLNMKEIKDIENIITSNLERNVDYVEYVDLTGFFHYEDAEKCFNDLFKKHNYNDCYITRD